MKNVFIKISLFAFILSFVLAPSISRAQIVSVEAASVSSDEVLGDDNSFSSTITPDGRYVTIYSESTNLVAGDTNAVGDVFLRDRTLGTTERISVSSDETEANDESGLAVLSEDGRYIVFGSSATNLVAGDTNSVIDVFLRDRTLGTTERVSVNEADEETDGDSYNPSITEDADYVIFESDATNLVAGDTNGAKDIFIVELATGTVERLSVTSAEVEVDDFSYDPSISNDGRYVSFVSDATNLVAGDTNGTTDIFLRDRTLGTTERISVSTINLESDGDASSSRVSPDGRYVVFGSDSTDLVTGDTNGVADIFLRDRTLETTIRVSVASDTTQSNGESTFPYVSDNGRFITFGSSATNLVEDDTNGDPDVFLHDTLTGITERISLKADSTQADGNLFGISAGVLSGDARFVIVSSGHTDIIAGDSNAAFDSFVYELDDGDGISSTVERAAPNDGDVNENGYADSVEQNITSFVNSVSGSYATIETTGDCTRNDSPSASAESSLATQDSGYDYPLGIISFEVNCKEVGETATVSIYCFCEVTPVDGTIARKYSESTGEYTTIDSAVIEEVTIDGQRALKMTYDVVDGGALDEDGLENGTIIDPVGFARVATPTPTTSRSSSGSQASPAYLASIGLTPIAVNTQENPQACTKHAFTTSMKKGSKQGEVSKLQELLNKLNLNAGPVDGLFGPMTHTAVKMFQTKHTLDSDGIVGPMTRGVLNEECL